MTVSSWTFAAALLLLDLNASAMADGGRITFSGAIVASTCSVDPTAVAARQPTQFACGDNASSNALRASPRYFLSDQKLGDVDALAGLPENVLAYLKGMDLHTRIQTQTWE